MSENFYFMDRNDSGNSNFFYGHFDGDNYSISGMNISKEAITTVQFTVDRFGLISNITLKRSSGNKTWDHLSMRAIQVARVPELPPNYRAPALSLNFNFTPK